MSERKVTAEDPRRTRSLRPPHVFHVRVIDTIAAPVEAVAAVDALVGQVARVVIEAEGGAPAYGLQRAFGGGHVERDLGRMYLERKADPDLVEDIEDRVPP